jgi:hypothetical protein
MPIITPDWRPVAFKEWQVVCDALESGEQAIILRKGGISEGKLGFQWLHERFFLFPTFFHEQVEQVKPDDAGQPRRFRPQRAGGEEIEIRLFAETVETARLTDWDAITALAPEHIWTEQTIRERYEWGDDELGISLARLRIHRLPEPWVLCDRAGFGGCRSWIGLPADEHPDLPGLLAAAGPVTA